MLNSRDDAPAKVACFHQGFNTSLKGEMHGPLHVKAVIMEINISVQNPFTNPTENVNIINSGAFEPEEDHKTYVG